ncbi:uncharacterized protein LOC127871119 [Dreissena polymorpha]|uniref:BTB domain-containing protein n=1 Tax=Dreissena polymorpha TaxID=45954 RepID=A0A9D4R6E5_DREPO|nr:uncharacterized protein LOC127871119 [Dreissena polymorpha]KAH3855943.1 hypothetical protein DPMN_098518 [Dreissena polymorpha]
MDETVIICVGDKRYNVEIKTLCKYSSLFSDLLKSLRRGEGKVPSVAASSKESTHVLLHRNTDVYEDAFVLEMNGIPSEDVKLTLDTMTTTMKDTSFTRSNILRMLPVVKELNISHLHRRIDKELLAILNSSASSSNVNMILENLQVAEEYYLSRVKQWCISAYVPKSSAHDRNTLLKDFHISDASKLEILNRMADAVSENYVDQLKGIREESERNCKQMEDNRAEFVSQTEQWKKELDKRVQVVIEQNKSLHKAFVDTNGFDWVCEKFDDMISSAFHEKKIFKELEQIKEQTKKMFENLGLIKDEALEAKMAEERSKIFVNEKKYTAGVNYNDSEIRQALSTLNKSWNDIENSIKSYNQTVLEKIKQCLETCRLNETVRESLTSQFALQTDFDELYQDLDKRFKKLTETEIDLKESLQELKRAKLEIQKYQRREHAINTWVKQGKPTLGNSNKCSCFRHSEMTRKLKSQ